MGSQPILKIINCLSECSLKILLLNLQKQNFFFEVDPHVSKAGLIFYFPVENYKI